MGEADTHPQLRAPGQGGTGFQLKRQRSDASALYTVAELTTVSTVSYYWVSLGPAPLSAEVEAEGGMWRRHWPLLRQGLLEGSRQRTLGPGVEPQPSGLCVLAA